MAESMAQEKQSGPPYPPHVAQTGGIPSILPDVPVVSVFTALYLAFAVTNIVIFRRNLSKGHKFIPSALLTGFSMARVLTSCLRIGWATRQTNVSLGIAASIFTNVGIIIVFILNVLFSQRILRAKQPRIGWNRGLRIVFFLFYGGLAVAIVLVIVLIVMSFYSLDPGTLEDAKWIQRGASLYILTLCVLPLCVVATAYSLPRSKHEEPFGHGSINTKAVVLTVGACLCTTIEGFKAGVGWSAPRPVTDPAWYDSKAAFYCFNYGTIEILILILYTLVARVDLRFYVPDGSSKRKTYVVQQERRNSEDSTENSVANPEKERFSSLEE